MSHNIGVYYEDGSPLYIPSEKQFLLHTNSKPYLLYGGARGGGKSYAAIWECIFTCLRIPGCNVVIVRKTYGQLEQGIINQFDNIPHTIYSENPKAFNRSSKCVRFDNGSKLWFKSCRNAETARNLFKGMEYVLICVDEMTEFTFEEFEEMKGGNRCPIKVDLNGDAVICKIIGLTNPGGPGHAFCKALFIDSKQVAGLDPDVYDQKDYGFIKSLVYDNPVYKNDKAYLKTLNSMSAALRAAYLEGDWNLFVGQYYTNFNPESCIIDEDIVRREMTKQPWQPKWVSIDWGFVHHAVVQWHTSIDITHHLIDEEGKKFEYRKNHVVTYRELLLREMGEAALAQELSRANGKDELKHIYLSPETFGDNPNSRSRLIGNTLISNGLMRPIPANNDRVDGWRFLYELFEDRPKSKLLISTACPHLVESIPVLIRNSPTKPEDVKKIDQEADDCGDCLRYGIMSYMKGRDKPEDIIFQEKLSKIEDPTIKNIFSLMEKEKNKKKNKSFRR